MFELKAGYIGQLCSHFSVFWLPFNACVTNNNNNNNIKCVWPDVYNFFAAVVIVVIKFISSVVIYVIRHLDCTNVCVSSSKGVANGRFTFNLIVFIAPKYLSFGWMCFFGLLVHLFLRLQMNAMIFHFSRAHTHTDISSLFKHFFS